MAVIKKFEGQYSIHILCEALNLPRGTYYNKKCRENTVTSYEQNDDKIKPIIKQIFDDSKKRFGRKPSQYKLADQDYRVSEKQVSRLMKEMGLEVEKPKYLAEHKKAIPRQYFKNHLDQEFEQDYPNKVWVSGITYVKVGMQYYYICFILELFSRKIISYGISDVIDTTLTLKTFETAFKKRNEPEGLMFHSGQGIQYTTYIFRKYMKSKAIIFNTGQTL